MESQYSTRLSLIASNIKYLYSKAVTKNLDPVDSTTKLNKTRHDNKFYRAFITSISKQDEMFFETMNGSKTESE